MATALPELSTLVLATHGYGCALVLGAAALRSPSLHDKRFSRAKFYALMGWVPLSFALLAVLRDPRFAAFFFLSGIAGVVSETLVSFVWRAFFRVPIWTYSYGAVVGGFTSKLNFLPWATGGLLFCLIGRALEPVLGAPPGFPVRAATVFGASLAVGLAVAWPLGRLTSARDGALSLPALLVFCLPIALAAAALAISCSPGYLLAMALFSLVGFATEYAYGRGMRLVFERGLWSYHPYRLDEGHTSWVTFPLWSIGGLFFHFVARAVGL